MDIRSIGIYSPKGVKSTTLGKKAGEKFSMSCETEQVKSGSACSTMGPSILFVEEDPQQKKRRRAFIKGKSLLSELDQLRISLLSGNICVQNLKNLDLLLKNNTTEDLPQDLQDLMLEIETRAAVELAKISLCE